MRGQHDVTVDTAAWVSAVDEICRRIAADQAHDPYREVVDRVLVAAAADLVAIVVPDPSGAAVVVAEVAGTEARRWHGWAVAAAGSVVGGVLDTGEARLLLDVTEHLGDNVRPISTVEGLLAVPVSGAAGVRAVLTIGRNAGRPPFTDADLTLAELFARQVGQALAHRDERGRVERAVVARERDRIALGLQANVIAPLFTLGMRLQAAAGQASGPAARHLESGSDEIDETLKAIRTTVYRFAD